MGINIGIRINRKKIISIFFNFIFLIKPIKIIAVKKIPSVNNNEYKIGIEINIQVGK